MPIDSFDRPQFEAALPIHKETGKRLWQSSGIIDGEFCYLLPVTVHSGLLVRSSIHNDGISAASGRDSIRVIVVRNRDLVAQGSKLQKHTTRLPNWESRLTSLLRRMWPMAKLTGPCTATSLDQKSREEHICPGWIWVYRCKKEGSPHKGQMFRKCSERTCRFFEWLPESRPQAKRTHKLTSQPPQPTDDKQTYCICPYAGCDCADPDGFHSEFCWKHNRYPIPWPGCKAAVHGPQKESI